MDKILFELKNEINCSTVVEVLQKPATVVSGEPATHKQTVYKLYNSFKDCREWVGITVVGYILWLYVLGINKYNGK